MIRDGETSDRAVACALVGALLGALRRHAAAAARDRGASRAGRGSPRSRRCWTCTTRSKASTAAIYNFNAGFDRYIFLPIVRAYEFVTPDFVEDRISDFFDNLTRDPDLRQRAAAAQGRDRGPGGDPLRRQHHVHGRPVRSRRRQGDRADQRGLRPDARPLGSGHRALSGAAAARALEPARHHRRRSPTRCCCGSRRRARSAARPPIDARAFRAAAGRCPASDRISLLSRPARRSSTSWSGCSTPSNASSTSRSDVSRPRATLLNQGLRTAA